MVDASSLNPQVLPSRPLPKEEHRKAIVAGVTAAVILVLLGLVYWIWSVNQKQYAAEPTVADLQAQMRDQIAQALSKAKPATQVQINSVAAQLSKAQPATEAAKQSVAAQLRKASVSVSSF